jgi:hypothetical protein
MRSRLLLGLLPVGAVVVAVFLAGLSGAARPASTAGASKFQRKAHLKIALPAPNQVKVSELTVNARAPKGKRVGALELVASNSAQLGTAQTNTQVVYAMSPPSSNKQSATFKVWVFIHRYPAARALATDRTASTAQEADVAFVAGIKVPGGLASFGPIIETQSCRELSHEKGPVLEKGKPPLEYNFLGDKFGQVVILGNLVAVFDTATEEQLDGAVYSKPCPGAENPADDPPPR